MSFSVENAEVFQFPYQADEQFPAPTHLPYRRIESQPKREGEGGELLFRGGLISLICVSFVHSCPPPAPSVSSARPLARSLGTARK